MGYLIKGLKNVMTLKAFQGMGAPQNVRLKKDGYAMYRITYLSVLIAIIRYLSLTRLVISPMKGAKNARFRMGGNVTKMNKVAKKYLAMD